jgi:hypothetical protein
VSFSAVLRLALGETLGLADGDFEAEGLKEGLAEGLGLGD